MLKDLKLISDCQASTKPVMRDLINRKSLSRSKSKTPTADIKVDQQTSLPQEWNYKQRYEFMMMFLIFDVVHTHKVAITGRNQS